MGNLKKLLVGLLAFSMVFTLLPAPAVAAGAWDGSVATAFAGGAGTSADPYRIATGAQLAYLTQQVGVSTESNVYTGKYFVLTDDIDLGNQSWTPIGNPSHHFNGVFDGGGCDITNLKVNAGSDPRGLFGRIEGDGVVKNLSVSGTITSGSSSSGGIVGDNNGRIENCSNFASVTGTASGFNGGGIAGVNGSSGKIENCFNTGAVTLSGGTGNLGGIAGLNGGAIKNCYWMMDSSPDVAQNAAGGSTSETRSFGTACLLSPSVSYGDTLLAALNGWVAGKTPGAYRHWIFVRGENDDFPIFSPFAGGTGIAADPYKVATAGALAFLAERVNANDEGFNNEYYLLTNDINLNGAAFTPIGNRPYMFRGSFDGDDHSITGLNVSVSGDAGLFGAISGGGQVLDLSVSGAVSSAGDLAGGIAGDNDGTIRNCSYAGTVNSTKTTGDNGDNRSTGGVAGRNDGTLLECSNAAAVSSLSYAGGVTGVNCGTIRNCRNTGAVNALYAGGIAQANLYGTIRNCYNTGTVNLTFGNAGHSGGVVGYNLGTVQNCYNIGAVSGDPDNGYYQNGGVLGANDGNASNCYWLAGTAAVGIDYTGADGTASDIGSFPNNSGALTTTGGTLLAALNGWVTAQTTPAEYLGWKIVAGNNGGYPVFVSEEGTAAANPVLVSITAPAAITGLANGIARTAFGLPATVALVTNPSGSYTGAVTWAVDSCSYNPASKAAQTFTVSGTVALPLGVDNPSNISKTVSVSVTVNAANPVLVSITAPAAITGLANGIARTAFGLPATVALVTNPSGSYTGTVTWDVELPSCPYDPTLKTAQTFDVRGAVTLPAGVDNPNGVSLTVSVSATVNAAAAANPALVSITAPAAITGVANGTAKTAEALGLPGTVALVTNPSGSFAGTVTWAVDSCSYNPASTAAQTFTVNGAVTLPSGVDNTNGVSLTVSVSVTVDAAVPVYTVVYDGNGASGGSTVSSAHTYGIPKNLTANGYTRTNYRFAGWAASPTGPVVYADRGSVINLTDTAGAIVTLYAKWTADAFSITYDLDGGTADLANPTGYTAESGAITLVNPTKSGFVFTGWSGTGIAGTSTHVVIPMGSAGDRSYTAHWGEPITGLPEEYTIYVGGHVTWNPAPQDGEWEWDSDYFSAAFDNHATFTALKSGKSSITYRTEGSLHRIQVTIRDVDIPATGDTARPWLWIGGGVLSLAGMAALLLILKKRSVRPTR